jgi:hypothetical protein
MNSEDKSSAASEASSFENGLEICEYSQAMKGRLNSKRKRNSNNELQTKYRKVFEQKCNGADEAKEQIRVFEKATALDKSSPMSTKADGVISSLIAKGCSEKVLRCVLGIGSGRYKRVRDNKRKQLASGTNSNHLKEEDIERLKHFFKTIPTEEGYSCAHCKIKHYIIEESMTWMRFWQRYKQNMESKHFRAMSYVRFLEYRQSMVPNLALTRVQEDVCDLCVHLKQIISVDLSSEEERLKATAALEERNSQ